MRVVVSYFRITALLFWEVVEGCGGNRCGGKYLLRTYLPSSVNVVSFDYVVVMLASFVVCWVVSAA
jgi:hypothetical protein